VHIDVRIVFAAAIVGFTVGLTGMGGGALMTPILLIFFNINPTAAVSSDLVAAMAMKPVGGGVHIRRRTVRWDLVRWLCIGSIPAAFGGVMVLQQVGDPVAIEDTTKSLLGITLLLAAAAMVFKSGARASVRSPRRRRFAFARSRRCSSVCSAGSWSVSRRSVRARSSSSV